MKQIMKGIVISFAHLVCFWCINCSLQTQLNKMMEGDLYVLIVLFLDVIAPILVLLFSNIFLFKENNYDEKIKSVLLSDVLLFGFGVVHILFFKDSNFTGISLWFYIIWIGAVSVAAVVYLLTRNPKAKESNTSMR